MPYRITEGMREFRMASDIIKAEQDNIESTMTLHDIFALKENLYFSMSCAGRDFRVRAQVGFENIYHEIRELPFGGDRLIYTYQLARNIGISDLELETTKSLFHWMYTDAKNDFSEFKDAVDYATIRDVKFQLRNLENTLHYALVTEGHMTEQEFVEEFGIGLL